MNTEDPSDRLIDSLLREQARRREADDELLAGIYTALDARPAARPSARAGRKTIIPLTAAAALVLSAGGIAWRMQQRPAPSLTTAEASLKEEAASLPVPPMESAGLDEAAWAAAMEETLGTLALNEQGKWVPHGGWEERRERMLRAVPVHEAVASAEAAPPVGGSGPVADPILRETESPSAEEMEKIVRETLAGLAKQTGDSRSEEIAGSADRFAEGIASRGRGDFGDGWGSAGDGAGAGESGSGAAPGFLPAPVARMPQDHTRLTGRGSSHPRTLPRPPAEADAGDVLSRNGLEREQYGRLTDQPWKSPWQDALSTFSIDVDTASYTNVRRMIESGSAIPPDAVRIEECLNYFDYRYAGPKGESAFAVHGTLAACPWKPGHLLARVAIKGRDVEPQARPASNLVFLIDVSGSMQSPDKLPLLKRSMKLLLDQLDGRDRVGMVVYAGTEGVALDSTTITEEGRSQAVRALEKLEAGGSTNGGAGIQRAYRMAADHFIQDGVNRVILATDGDFNVGTTGQGQLVSLVKEGAAKGVSISVLGFGAGNFNDAMLEAITNEGNGESYYIDRDKEARRVFQEKLTGTLLTIAKDVKIQVEFNPGKVQAYRLIGYANRILRHEDFANDKVDAGDIGAGHTVTAFYEIVPHGVEMPDTGKVDALRYQRPAGREAVPSEDWFTLKLRHKQPMGEVSALTEMTVRGEPLAWEKADLDFRFASSVALFGMKLRGMKEVEEVSWAAIREMAKPALADDPREQRAEFLGLLEKLGK